MIDGRVPAITVLGEALIDLIPDRAGATYLVRPGGSPLNVAVGTSRLGNRTALFARFAPDHFGDLLRAHATNNGIDLSGAIDTIGTLSTLAVASLDPHAQADYTFYTTGTPDWHWSAEELHDLPRGAAILHTGSLASWMPPGDQVILDQLRSCKAAQHSIISYDPNIRRQLLSSPAAGRARAETFIAAAHIVKASEDDLHWLYPTSTIHDVARCWLQLGATLIIITHGSRGATAFTAAGQRIEHPTPKVSVVDTIGAGDAFTAGLLHSLLNQPRARDQLRDPTNDGTLAEDDIRALLNAATTSAALTCTRAGAEPPYKVEFAVAPGQNQP